MTEFCPETGKGHHYKIPSAPEIPLGECECGATKLFDNWAQKTGSRRMISRVLAPGKKKHYRQRDLVVTGSTLWAEARKS